MPGTLTPLKARLRASGWSAESPDTLDPEGERMAREERRQ